MRRAPVAGLGVRDEDLVGLFPDEVRLAGDGGGRAPQPEEVLVLGVDDVAGALEALAAPC